MSRTRQWTIGAAVVMVLLLVAGWFLVISPEKGNAASLNAKTATQQVNNSRLQLQLEQLKAEHATLPAQEAILAEIQQHIPVSTPALPALVRQFSTDATAAGVTLTSLSPDTPTMYPVGQVTNPVLWEATVAITATGSYFNMERFVSGIEAMQRSVLVTGFSFSPNTGSTSVTTGELTLDLNAQVYFTAPPTGATH